MPQLRNGMQMRLDEANEKGGVHGRKFVLIEEDDQCDPSKGVIAVKKLIHSHKVFMLHGAGCSNVALAVRPEIQQARIPWMVLGATNLGIYMPTDPNIFGVVLTSDIEGSLLVDFAMSTPSAKRVAIVAHHDAWGQGKYDPVMKRLQEQYKSTPVADETMDRGANDASAQALRIKQANPDAVIVILYPKEGAIFLRDAVKYGMNSVFVANSALEDVADLVAKAGTDAVAKNLYAMTLVRHTMDSPEFSPILQRFKAHYPNLTIATFATWAYAGAEVMVEGIRRVGRDLTREKLVKEIEKLRGFESAVFPGTLNFSPEDHRGNRTANFVVYKDGKQMLVGSKYVPIR
jgi:branched-chain amino acid transport system substrate-binding protein